MAKTTNVYKLTPTLDSLSYKVVISDANKELQIVLPCSTLPDKKKIFKQQNANKKKEAVEIKSANAVKICILFINKTDGKPTVTLTSNSTESKIKGQVNLKPNTCQIFEFYSANGGLNWFIDALGKQDDETTVNGKLGPNITIDANDIKLSADDPDSITIKEKLDELSEVKIAGPDTIGGIMVSEFGDINVNAFGVVTIKDKAIVKSKLADDVQNEINNAATKSELDGVKTDLDNLQTTHQQNIETLQSAIDKNKSDISKVSGDLDTAKTEINNNINNVQADLDTVKTDVSGIHDSINTINTNIESIQTDTEGIHTSIDNINEEIETLHTDVSGVQANLDKAVKDINDNLPKNVMDIVAANVDNIVVEPFNV